MAIVVGLYDLGYLLSALGHRQTLGTPAIYVRSAPESGHGPYDAGMEIGVQSLKSPPELVAD